MWCEQQQSPGSEAPSEALPAPSMGAWGDPPGVGKIPSNGCEHAF